MANTWLFWTGTPSSLSCQDSRNREKLEKSLLSSSSTLTTEKCISSFRVNNTEESGRLLERRDRNRERERRKEATEEIKITENLTRRKIKPGRSRSESGRGAVRKKEGRENSEDTMANISENIYLPNPGLET
jgi:hypothetical protein